MGYEVGQVEVCKILIMIAHSSGCYVETPKKRKDT